MLSFSSRQRYFLYRGPTPAFAPEQMALWDEGADAGAVEVKKQTVTYERKKKAHPGRTQLPDNLPVEEVIIEPEADTSDMTLIGEEVTETLDFKPGSNQRLRPYY